MTWMRRGMILGLILTATMVSGQPASTGGGDRDAWQEPRKVVEWLRLRPGAVVADLGAGSGYFTFPLAQAVGPEGIVYAVDIDADSLKRIQASPRRTSGNIVTVLGSDSDSMLPDGRCDLIFICDTYHHFTDRVNYLKRLATKLRPGGRIVSVDFHKKEMPVGPPVAHKLDQKIAEDEARQAGYTVQADTTLLQYQYILTFTPPAPHTRKHARRTYGSVWFNEPPQPQRKAR